MELGHTNMDYKQPPANVATLIYTPLVKQDEDMVVKRKTTTRQVQSRHRI